MFNPVPVGFSILRSSLSVKFDDSRKTPGLARFSFKGGVHLDSVDSDLYNLVSCFKQQILKFDVFV